MARLYFFRSLLVVAGLGCTWLVGGRSLAAVLDRLFLTRRVSLPVTRLKYDGGGLVIDGVTLTFGGFNNQRSDLALRTDSEQRVVLSSGEDSLALGPRMDSDQRSGQVEMSFAADPGDRVSLTAQRSLLGWATPFEFHILARVSPWWKRYVYYRLTWKKASGAVLQMVWRYEQQYYRNRGWTTPEMMWNSATGLQRVQIVGRAEAPSR